LKGGDSVAEGDDSRRGGLGYVMVALFGVGG
jgi:hypothetical protein